MEMKPDSPCHAQSAEKSDFLPGSTMKERDTSVLFVCGMYVVPEQRPQKDISVLLYFQLISFKVLPFTPRTRLVHAGSQQTLAIIGSAPPPALGQEVCVVIM